MICPKCGVFVADNRESCPSCGTPVSRESYYSDFQGSEYDQQYPGGQTGAGAGGQYPGRAPGATGGRGKGKIIAGVIIVIVIIVVAVIGLTLMNKISLEIVEIDTSGAKMIITVKNNGWDDAKGSYIEVRCNGEDTFDWPEGDIENGKEKTAKIQVADDEWYFITKVEVFYEGNLQDSRGY